MPVVDKYRPIRLDPLSRDGWAPVVAGMWVTVALLSVLGADHLHRAAVARHDGALTDVLVATTATLEDVAEATGVLAARRAVDEALAPLEDSTRIWRDHVPPPTATTPVASDPDAPPTVPRAPVFAGRPERILVVGASSIEYRLGTELQRRLGAYEGVTVERFGKLGTGLIRDDVFDWHAEIATRLEAFDPDVVIMQLGGNDGQSIEVPGKGRVSFGTEAWVADYEARVGRLIDLVEGAGALPVFLGLPVMKDEGFSKRMKVINELLARVATREGARFVDTWSLTADDQGAYRTHLTWDGRNALMRLPDGIHLSTEGSAFVASELMLRLEREFVLVEPDPALAVVVRGEVDSKARGKSVPWLAAVPRDTPPTGLPVLYLLHGAWDDYTAWWTHAHRDIQRLATEHRLIILTPDGEPFGWYLDSPIVADNQIETFVVDELIGAAEAVLPANGRRSIGGLSMGGHGAILLSLDHPDRFVAASSMSGALDLDRVPTSKQITALLGDYASHRADWDRHNVARRLVDKADVARKLPLLISCGDKDVWFAKNREVHEQLDALTIPHTWEVTAGADHAWDYWVDQLPRHVAWHAERLSGGSGASPDR